MNKYEAKFHTKLTKWLKYNLNLFPDSFLFESKVIRPKSNSFPFAELTKKEEYLLLKAKRKAIIQTHSDISRLGTNCDGCVIAGGGFIFLQRVKRGNKIFYCIDIDDFLKEKKTSARKSLTEQRALVIGTIYLLK